MKKEVLIIMKGGMKLYNTLPAELKRIAKLYYPDKNMQDNPKINSDSDVIYIVDNNVFSGVTVFKVIQRYNIPLQSVNLDYCSIARPVTDQCNITLSGNACVGKSFIAHSLRYLIDVNCQTKIIKQGDIATQQFIIGNYGECVPNDLLGIKVANEVRKNNNYSCIIDGVKTVSQYYIISYISGVPTLPIYVTIPESIRKIMLQCRKDKDDAYDTQRKAFFCKDLSYMADNKALLLDITDDNHNLIIKAIQTLTNINTNAFVPNTVFYKPAILRAYLKSGIKSNMIDSTLHIPDTCYFHKNYLDRFNIPDFYKEIVIGIASSFRLIDDILDEHTTRNGKPAAWCIYGVFNTLLIATKMLQVARNKLSDTGKLIFDIMFEGTCDGVFAELHCERYPTKPPNIKNYLQSLHRETFFRNFLWQLANNTTENNKETVVKAVRAQIKDDIKGADKHGREDNEKRLNRPSIYIKNNKNINIDNIITEYMLLAYNPLRVKVK